MAPIIIKDPNHPDYPHGKPLGYSRGCHCQPCRTANTQAGLRTRRLRASGRAVMVDARPAQAHLDVLLAVPGATYRNIARLTGLDRSTIGHLHHHSAHCYRTAADAILALTAEAVAPAERRPWSEAVRMVRCLQAHGWPLGHIAERTGCAPGTAGVPLLSRPSESVTPALWAALTALYREYEAKPGPSDPARRVARAHGYYPPACYDDDGRLIRGAVRRADYKGAPDREVARRWEVLRLLLAGKTYAEIADRLDCNEKAADRVMRRWGLRSVYDGYETRFRPGQRHVLRVLRDAVAELDLCLVDPIEFEVEVTARVAAVRAQFAARRRQIKALRAPYVPASTARGHVIRLRRASDTSARAA